VLHASRTTASAPVSAGEAGPAAALSDDLAKLSRDIASHIAELNQSRARTPGGQTPQQGSTPLTDESPAPSNSD